MQGKLRPLLCTRYTIMKFAGFVWYALSENEFATQHLGFNDCSTKPLSFTCFSDTSLVTRHQLDFLWMLSMCLLNDKLVPHLLHVLRKESCWQGSGVCRGGVSQIRPKIHGQVRHNTQSESYDCRKYRMMQLKYTGLITLTGGSFHREADVLSLYGVM